MSRKRQRFDDDEIKRNVCDVCDSKPCSTCKKCQEHRKEEKDDDCKVCQSKGTCTCVYGKPECEGIDAYAVLIYNEDELTLAAITVDRKQANIIKRNILSRDSGNQVFVMRKTIDNDRLDEMGVIEAFHLN